MTFCAKHQREMHFVPMVSINETYSVSDIPSYLARTLTGIVHKSTIFWHVPKQICYYEHRLPGAPPVGSRESRPEVNKSFT